VAYYCYYEARTHHRHHIYSPIITQHKKITKIAIQWLPEKPYSSLTGRPTKKVDKQTETDEQTDRQNG